MAEYIEREALLDDIENACVFSGRPDHQNPKQTGARLVVQRIRAAKAADVAPVVHGRWETSTDPEFISKDFSCSVCEELLCDFDTTCLVPGENCYYYCPNCGARMDGE